MVGGFQECKCYLRNIPDKLSDVQTLYERRFARPLCGPIIPNGATVEYHPISAELEEMDASELHAIRLNAKEVLTPLRSGNFIFPFADGTLQIFGRERRLRTSTLPGSVRNEAQNKKFFKEIQMSGVLHSIFKQTQPVMMRR